MRLTDRELYDEKVTFTKCQYTNCPDKCSQCEIPKEAELKLKEYEDLEEQGLLVKLPCPIGTTVYVLVEEYEEMYEPSSKYIDIYTEGFELYMIDSIGKDIFLTSEEAEQARANMSLE